MSDNTNTMAARKQIGQTDSNEPQKPLSAYAVFFKDTVSKIKQENPNCAFQELSRIVASMWEILDEDIKNLYNKKHDIARQEYIKQMQVYMQQQQQQNFEITNCEDDNGNKGQLQSKAAALKINSAVQQVVANNNVNNNMSSEQQFADSTTPESPQIQLLTEAGAVQKCSRENCNKRAIINPDWEDEYCSNECVISHCRNVFNSWVQSNLVGRTEQTNS